VKVGDLVRHKETGELAIVEARGEGSLEIWMTLITFDDSRLGKYVVYLAEYFELVSEANPESKIDD